MDEKIEHRPDIRPGFALHFGLILINTAISGYLLFLALSSQVRGVFILYLVASIITYLPAPFLFYQAFALARAKYTISRNGIAIQWGLRTEDIPIDEIDWIRLPRDFVNPIAPPPFRLAGAVLASTSDRDLGTIEYISSRTQGLVLIATRSIVFVISPGNPHAFIEDFHRSAELGSFSPIQKRSSQPQLILAQLARDKVARPLLLASLTISLLMLIAVSFIIPTRSSVPLGLEALGANRESSPSERLLLLPLLSLFVFFIDLAFGSYLYRKKGFKNAAYIVFFSSLFLPLSFSTLIILILFT